MQEMEKIKSISHDAFIMLDEKLRKEFGNDMLKQSVLVTAGLFYSALKSYHDAGGKPDPLSCMEELNKLISKIIGASFRWKLGN